jgi:hypothetical protein
MAMDKVSGAVVDLGVALPSTCHFHPIDEYKGKLLATADDPDDGTVLGQLYRFDPTGQAPPELATHFPATISPTTGASRTGPSLYVGQQDACVLRVFRAELDSFSQDTGPSWELGQSSGFSVDGLDLYWVDQRYVDRSELHRQPVQGEGADEIVTSFEGGIGGEPILDGNHLWLFAGGRSETDPIVYVRVMLDGGQVDRFEMPYLIALLPLVRPEGLYVTDGTQLYLQPRP